ncbi:hypothetical protein CYMTET_24548 [Cymbomonas tetramitiformis]|uniref:Uncharacterized protein n=1 Tax=Cymbomonas tetramitiformis TaxID=36881 RepID=A0AAE0FVL7_9CHLO|nr:hypothetical protein CYMTET_24548 [Cymbomonas tetramitiformis]
MESLFGLSAGAPTETVPTLAERDLSVVSTEEQHIARKEGVEWLQEMEVGQRLFTQLEQNERRRRSLDDDSEKTKYLEAARRHWLQGRHFPGEGHLPPQRRKSFDDQKTAKEQLPWRVDDLFHQAQRSPFFQETKDSETSAEPCEWAQELDAAERLYEAMLEAQAVEANKREKDQPEKLSHLAQGVAFRRWTGLEHLPAHLRPHQQLSSPDPSCTKAAHTKSSTPTKDEPPMTLPWRLDDLFPEPAIKAQMGTHHVIDTDDDDYDDYDDGNEGIQLLPTSTQGDISNSNTSFFAFPSVFGEQLMPMAPAPGADDL